MIGLRLSTKLGLNLRTENRVGLTIPPNAPGKSRQSHRVIALRPFGELDVRNQFFSVGVDRQKNFRDPPPHTSQKKRVKGQREFTLVPSLEPIPTQADNRISGTVH